MTAPRARLATASVLFVAAGLQVGPAAGTAAAQGMAVESQERAFEARAAAVWPGVAFGEARSVAPAPRRPLVPIALGTVAGGGIGGAALGGLGWLLGSAGPDDGFMPASVVFGIVGFGVGYPLGAAVGARLAATREDGARPRFAMVLLASAGSALAGWGLADQVGKAVGDNHGTGAMVRNLAAVAGVASHALLTALVARETAAAAPAPVPAPGDPGR